MMGSYSTVFFGAKEFFKHDNGNVERNINALNSKIQCKHLNNSVFIISAKIPQVDGNNLFLFRFCISIFIYRVPLVTCHTVTESPRVLIQSI